MAGIVVGVDGSEHSVEALTPLTLCVFPRSKLYELYSEFPTLAFDITWLAAREEQLIDEHLVSLGRRSAKERTAFLLLNLFERAKVGTRVVVLPGGAPPANTASAAPPPGGPAAAAGPAPASQAQLAPVPGAQPTVVPPLPAPVTIR